MVRLNFNDACGETGLIQPQIVIEYSQEKKIQNTVKVVRNLSTKFPVQELMKECI